MDEQFNNWLKTPKDQGGAGLAVGTPLDKTTYNMLMREYVKGTSSFQPPSIVPVTNPITQEVSPAFMSSANSATLMRDTQPRTTYKPDKDGNLLAIEGTSANYVTNNTGERIKVDPKSNRLEDLMAAMGGMGGQAPAEESPGILSRIFGGVPATNAPTATPTPMPTATPAPTPAMTNAPAPVATPAPTPAVFSAADFRQMTGQTLPPGDYEDAQGRPFTIR